jgi:hypothetical protein
MIVKHKPVAGDRLLRVATRKTEIRQVVLRVIGSITVPNVVCTWRAGTVRQHDP